MSHHQLVAEAMMRDRMRAAAAARTRRAVQARHHRRHPVVRLARRMAARVSPHELHHPPAGLNVAGVVVVGTDRP